MISLIITHKGLTSMSTDDTGEGYARESESAVDIEETLHDDLVKLIAYTWTTIDAD